MNCLRFPGLAALLAAAACAPAQAEETQVADAVRLEVATLPMLQLVAKSGSSNPLKPAPVPRIPGPMLSLHQHAMDDGVAGMACTEDHSRVELPARRPMVPGRVR